MRMILVLLLLADSILAQTPTPGVITVTQSYSISATAGGLRCTIATTTKGASISAYCYVGTTLAFNSTIATLPTATQTNGAAISYSYNGDNLTGLFWRPTVNDPVQWQLAANGISKAGTF